MGTSKSKRRKKQQQQRQQQQLQQQQQTPPQDVATPLATNTPPVPPPPPPATPPGSTEPPPSTPVKSPVDPPSVHRLPVVPPPSYQPSESSAAPSKLANHDTTMISQELAQLVEALQQQKEETKERQAAFEARLSQQQQVSVSIHGLVHTLMDQTNKQLGLMGIGGISPIPSNASSSLDHHPNGLLPMRQGVEGTTGSIAQSQGGSEPVGLDPGLMSDVEDHLGPSLQPQVDIDVAIPPCGDEVIDHLSALKEEDKTTKNTSTQPTPTHGSSLPSTFSLPYTPVPPVSSNHAPAQPVQPVSSTAIFQYPKRYHRSGDNNRFYRQPDLIFPEALPHRQETHYSGRWIINPDMRKGSGSSLM
ncbi:unknown protein [Seminavis robusta]|uniref:Uncharacterized protein n=1 Tax=Seminavis robusta TaxID=568900 RepID=A0A9N8F1R2_9STRA|nr:unknown protein [Seminavis robusta]|eukprot:Sro3380_g347450.1 n/a (360) ;mRNA; r:1845-3042